MSDLKMRNAAGKSGASNVHFLTADSSKNTNPDRKPQALRIADDPTMQQAVQKIYSQGPRMVLELLNALAEKNMQALAIEREIKNFSLLPADALRMLGCDQIRRFQPLEVPQ